MDREFAYGDLAYSFIFPFVRMDILCYIIITKKKNKTLVYEVKKKKNRIRGRKVICEHMYVLRDDNNVIYYCYFFKKGLKKNNKGRKKKERRKKEERKIKERKTKWNLYLILL